MLLHAILLLLGSLAVAEFTRPCDTSLIKGVPSGELSFNFTDAASASGRLTVRCAGNYSLAGIKLVSGPDTLHSNLFDSLTCEAGKGWTADVYLADESRHHKIADASSPVTIACFEYCAVESTQGEVIARRTADDVSTLSVECPAGHELYYDSSAVLGGKLSCSLGAGWTSIDSTSLAANTSAPLQVECRDYSHCDPSLVQRVGALEIKFKKMVENAVDGKASMQRSYECAHSDTPLTEIRVNSGGSRHRETYRSLRCDENGWHGYNDGKLVQFNSKNASSITASCIEYCAVTGGAELHIDRGNRAIIIKCADSQANLYYNGECAKGNRILCTARDGWSVFATNIGPGNSSERRQHLECRTDSPSCISKRSVRAMRTAEGKQEEREDRRG